VKGPNFFSLHELFDKVAEELEGFADEIAERAVALGGTALGTLRLAAANSRLSEYPADLSAGSGHVEALSSALAAFGKSLREAIDAASKAGDTDTSDLFTEVSRSVDKLLWFVEAHDQGKQ
jgi:starvation-inducible DNA-binding protein